MTILKDFFTININCRFFIPTIKEDEKYYHIEYNRNKSTGVMHFAVMKTSNLRMAKKTIACDIYNILKERGVY